MGLGKYQDHAHLVLSTMNAGGSSLGIASVNSVDKFYGRVALLLVAMFYDNWPQDLTTADAIAVRHLPESIIAVRSHGPVMQRYRSV